MPDLTELAHAARNRLDTNGDLVCRFHLLGRPIPKGSMRGRFINGRVTLYSDNPSLSQWTHDTFWTAKHAYQGPLILGPVECVLDYVVPVPASRVGDLWPSQQRTGDLDKLTRATLDGLTGSIWKDDSQVVRIVASKRYANASLSRHPGVTVSIYQIQG